MLQWVNRGSVFCMICGKMKQNQNLLIKHLYIEHKIQCGHCQARFTSELELSSHMSGHGNGNCPTLNNLCRKRIQSVNYTTKDDTLFKCGVCNDSFTKTEKHDCNKSSVPQNPSDYSFKCELCSLSFLRRFDLKKHKVKCHSKENLDSNKENGCDNGKVMIKLNTCMPKRELDNADEDKSCDEDDIHCFSDSNGSIKEESSKLLFVRPKVKLIDENNYSCTFCEYACKLKNDLTFHYENSHNAQESDKCDVKSSSTFNKPHSCSLCKSSYSRRSDLQRHIFNKHSGEKTYGRSSDSIDDMDAEIINQAKRDINGIIVYYCGICKKNIRTKRGFVRHVRVHSGERPFTCHVCGKQYRSSTDLSRHLKCVHEGVKKYQCDICGRCFANNGTRNDHRRTHTGEKPFMCHICGKSFPTPNSIYVHRRIHSDYFPHHCTNCDKKFRRKQQLIHHVRTHTGEKPHACDVCGKCFAIKDEVSRHKLTHSNEKPHVCPICGLSFGQKRYLSNHTKTHHSRLL